jgi:hypothetical protein
MVRGVDRTVKKIHEEESRIVQAAIRREMGTEEGEAEAEVAAAEEAATAMSPEPVIAPEAVAAGEEAGAQEVARAEVSPAAAPAGLVPVPLFAAGAAASPASLSPLPEWKALRDFLSPLPYLGAHTDTIMSGVQFAREKSRGRPWHELAFAVFVVLGTLALLMEHGTGYSIIGYVFSMLLPWRWFSLLFGSPSTVYFLAAIVCLVVGQQTALLQNQNLLIRMESQHQQREARMMQQLEETKRLLEQLQAQRTQPERSAPAASLESASSSQNRGSSRKQ